MMIGVGSYIILYEGLCCRMLQEVSNNLGKVRFYVEEAFKCSEQCLD